MRVLAVVGNATAKPLYPVDAFQNRNLTPNGAAMNGCVKATTCGLAASRGGRMKRFMLVVIPALMLCVMNAAQGFAASSLESDCKNGLKEAKTKIEAMSNRATKRQAKALAQDATTYMKSGDYQNCVDKLQQIKTLTH